MKRVIVLLVALMLVGCSAVASGQSEKSAKKDLEKYLEYMKVGDKDNASTYLDYYTDSLIDVFEYKYLNLIEEEDVENRTYWSKYEYEDGSYMQEQYGEWEEFIEHLTELYDDREEYEFEADEYSVSYWKVGDTYKKYTFLYDMEVANGLGNKLYKKVEFELEWDESRFNGEDLEEGFIITEITIR